MKKVINILITGYLLTVADPQLRAQSIYVYLNDQTHVQYDLTGVNDITFTDSVLNLNLSNGTILSWPTDRISYYNYNEYSTGITAPPLKLSDDSQVYPNPSNGIMNINYKVPVACAVSIEIIDMRGRILKIMNKTETIAGQHTMVWDCKNGNGEQLVSGAYLCRVKIGEEIITHKISIVN